MPNKRELLDPSIRGPEVDDLEWKLGTMIAGQPKAIKAITSTYQTMLSGMKAPRRPVGNFLFLGPTGTGKTRVVEALAECLLGDSRAVTKVDCAEFQHSHEIAKLIGSPPGYLGHRETHPALSQEMLNRFHTYRTRLNLVLFDEIEKASDALWNLLLGITDKGELTLGDNRLVDFSRSMIFMTSNLGAKEMQNILRPTIGFATNHTTDTREKQSRKIEEVARNAARRKFQPEFLNRIDHIVVFETLNEQNLRQILKIEIENVRMRFRNLTTNANLPFIFTLTDSAFEFLLKQGTSQEYGARPMKRALDNWIVNKLSNLFASAQIKMGDHILVDLNPSGEDLLFFKDYTAPVVVHRVLPKSSTKRAGS